MDKTEKDDAYYKVLEFLNSKVQSNELDEISLQTFKRIIRDNKYVSTYIRSLKQKMIPYKSIDDFIRAMDKHADKVGKQSIEDIVDWEVRDLLKSTWSYNPNVDPIEIINNIISNTLDREGKICDFRDSIHPNTKIGICESEDHQEFAEDDITKYLNDTEQKEYHTINENDDGTSQSAYEKFIDKFNPPTQKLTLMLCEDEDIHKFDDTGTCYACDECSGYASDNDSCEVSCDMEGI